MDIDPTVSRHEIGTPTQLSHDLSALNVKALVCTFNQEKTLVGAFSVIVIFSREPSFKALLYNTTDCSPSQQMEYLDIYC